MPASRKKNRVQHDTHDTVVKKAKKNSDINDTTILTTPEYTETNPDAVYPSSVTSTFTNRRTSINDYKSAFLRMY